MVIFDLCLKATITFKSEEFIKQLQDLKSFCAEINLFFYLTFDVNIMMNILLSSFACPNFLIDKFK